MWQTGAQIHHLRGNLSFAVPSGPTSMRSKVTRPILGRELHTCSQPGPTLDAKMSHPENLTTPALVWRCHLLWHTLLPDRHGRLVLPRCRHDDTSTVRRMRCFNHAEAALAFSKHVKPRSNLFQRPLTTEAGLAPEIHISLISHMDSYLICVKGDKNLQIICDFQCKSSCKTRRTQGPGCESTMCLGFRQQEHFDQTKFTYFYSAFLICFDRRGYLFVFLSDFFPHF